MREEIHRRGVNLRSRALPLQFRLPLTLLQSALECLTILASYCNLPVLASYCSLTILAYYCSLPVEAYNCSLPVLASYCSLVLPSTVSLFWLPITAVCCQFQFMYLLLAVCLTQFEVFPIQSHPINIILCQQLSHFY